MAMSFKDALDDVEGLRFRADQHLDTALSSAAERVAEEAADISPVKTGRFQASWTTSGPSVRNTAPYASEVRGDWVDRNLPPLLLAEDDQIRQEVTTAITRELE